MNRLLGQCRTDQSGRNAGIMTIRTGRSCVLRSASRVQGITMLLGVWVCVYIIYLHLPKRHDSETTKTLNPQPYYSVATRQFLSTLRSRQMVGATKSAGCVPRFVKFGPADLPCSRQEYKYMAAVETGRTEGSNSSSAGLRYTLHIYNTPRWLADSTRQCI